MGNVHITMSESTAETVTIPGREDGEVWRACGNGAESFHTTRCQSLLNANSVRTVARERVSDALDHCKICAGESNHRDPGGNPGREITAQLRNGVPPSEVFGDE